MENEKAIKTHQPCEDCGSSDALAIYPDHTYCHSCKARTTTEGSEGYQSSVSKVRDSSLLNVKFQGLASRQLTRETCQFFSYGVGEYFGEYVQVAQYLDENRQVVAQKIRKKNKEFPWINRSATTQLYGQWLWRDAGKMVVITEGELDAMSVSQVQNNKWPTVSLPDGAGNAAKAIKENITWLNRFEKVVLFFDNDEAGREAVKACRKFIKTGHCYVAFAPEGYKDANDMLVKGKGSELVNVIFSAKQYRPDGLVSGNDIIKRLTDRKPTISYPYPDYLPDFQDKTQGQRMSELSTWTSGTGMGKTTIIKALQHHYYHNTDFNQSLIHLEEPLEDTADDLIAYEIADRFPVTNPGFIKTKEYSEVAHRLFDSKDTKKHPRFQLFDAFGGLEDDTLFEIIRYSALALNCKIIWIDHLSILVSDMDEHQNENRVVDKVMHALKNLTIELGVSINLVAHLRKPSGSSGERGVAKSFETGAVPTLDDMKGSGSIKQLSNNVYALSRNQQAENIAERNITHMHVLKCRKTGRTGPADYVAYNDKTGRIESSSGPDALAAFSPIGINNGIGEY